MKSAKHMILFLCFSLAKTESSTSYHSLLSLSLSIQRELSSHRIISPKERLPPTPSSLLYQKSEMRNRELDSVFLSRVKRKIRNKKQIIVAIIDTGIDITHKSLKKSLWINPGESGRDSKGIDRSSNGIDDDGNGLIDDVHGWNFVHNNNYIMDQHGHGTHIAGIIVGQPTPQRQIQKTTPQIQLMTLKYYDPLGQGLNNLKNTVSAIHYAIAHGADIINYSSGGLLPSIKEKKAIQKARDQGILFVSASGNEQANLDKQSYYPADYGLENIVSVTAIDRSHQVLSTSNYSQNKVDIAAPGKDIYSTLPFDSFGKMTGTSQATAFVSRVAALILSYRSYYHRKPYRLKKALIHTGTQEKTLMRKTKYRVRLNPRKALLMRGVEDLFLWDNYDDFFSKRHQ